MSGDDGVDVDVPRDVLARTLQALQRRWGACVCVCVSRSARQPPIPVSVCMSSVCPSSPLPLTAFSSDADGLCRVQSGEKHAVRAGSHAQPCYSEENKQPEKKRHFATHLIAHFAGNQTGIFAGKLPPLPSSFAGKLPPFPI